MARRRQPPPKKKMSGARICMSALLLLLVLIGISYGATAWERAQARGTNVLTELTQAFEEADLPFLTANTAAAPAMAMVNPTANPTLAPTPIPTQAPTVAPTMVDTSRAVLVQPKVEMPMLVSAASTLPTDYEPKDLVLMRSYCPTDIVTIKGSEIQGQREAVDALLTMLTQARAEGVDNWQVSAGYRSIKYQQSLFDDQVYTYRKDNNMSREQAIAATKRYVAEPGASEHHTGLAFDITVPGESFRLTPQSKWLAANCWDYGFIIRYTEEKESITGIAAEPWHIRYVGQPHARIMYENGWCLEEYLAANP